jgi:hypothetical protein
MGNSIEATERAREVGSEQLSTALMRWFNKRVLRMRARRLDDRMLRRSKTQCKPLPNTPDHLMALGVTNAPSVSVCAADKKARYQSVTRMKR